MGHGTQVTDTSSNLSPPSSFAKLVLLHLLDLCQDCVLCSRCHTQAGLVHCIQVGRARVSSSNTTVHAGAESLLQLGDRCVRILTSSAPVRGACGPFLSEGQLQNVVSWSRRYNSTPCTEELGPNSWGVDSTAF